MPEDELVSEDEDHIDPGQGQDALVVGGCEKQCIDGQSDPADEHEAGAPGDPVRHARTCCGSPNRP